MAQELERNSKTTAYDESYFGRAQERKTKSETLEGKWNINVENEEKDMMTDF